MYPCADKKTFRGRVPKNIEVFRGEWVRGIFQDFYLCTHIKEIPHPSPFQIRESHHR